MDPVESFNVTGLGWPDMINIAIRLILLFVLGATSQLTLQKRFYSMTLFLLGVWLTFFRLTILRAVLLYVGIFNPVETNRAVSQIVYNFFQSSSTSNISSLIALAGAIALFRWIAQYYKEGGKK